MTQLSKYPLTFFFDGRCGMCTTGAKTAQTAVLNGKLTLVDISAPDFEAEGFHFCPDAVQQSLHVLDAAGRVYVGINSGKRISQRRRLRGVGKNDVVDRALAVEPRVLRR